MKEASPRAPQSAWRNRGLLTLVSAGFITQIGSWMVTVTLPIFLIERYGLNLQTGLTLGARVVPNLLLGAVVGRLIDRNDPRIIVAVASVVGAGCVLVIPWTNALWQLQLIALVIGVGYMFAVPSVMALRPRVIRAGEEMAGNSLLVGMERLPQLAGPLIAAPIIAMGGVPAVFYTDAALGCAAAGLFLALPKSVGAAKDAAPAPAIAFRPTRNPIALFLTWCRVLGGGVVELARIIRADGMVFGLTLTGFTYVFAMGVGRLFLAKYALSNFSIPGMLGYLFAAMGLGGAIGALTAPYLRRGAAMVYVLGNVFEAVCWPLLLLFHNTVLAVMLTFSIGMFESVATVVYFAEVQRRIARGLIGRYWALLIPLTDACTFAGLSIGGPIAHRSLVVSASVIAIFIAVPTILVSPGLFRASAADSTKGAKPEGS